MGRFGPKGGRKPKPPILGVLPSGTALEKQPVAGAPSCPASLTNAQKTVFRTTVNELAATPGWLQRADRAVLVAFAVHTVNFRNAQKHRDLEGDVLDTCDKHGEVGQKTSQWVFIAQKESILAMQAGDRLGLNPSSRETLHVEPPKFGGLDLLTPPPPMRPPYMNVLKARESLTQTVYKRETVQVAAVPDPIIEIQPDQVVEGQPDPVSQDPVVPVADLAAGAVVEGQVVTPSVDQQPVEDPAAGASNNQDGQPADLPVEPPAAGALPAEPVAPVKPTRPVPSFHYIGRR